MSLTIVYGVSRCQVSVLKTSLSKVPSIQHVRRKSKSARPAPWGLRGIGWEDKMKRDKKKDNDRKWEEEKDKQSIFSDLGASFKQLDHGNEFLPENHSATRHGRQILNKLMKVEWLQHLRVGFFVKDDRYAQYRNAFMTVHREYFGGNFGVLEVNHGLFRGLDNTELAAVIAHELGHYYHHHGPKRTRLQDWLKLGSAGVVLLPPVLGVSYILWPILCPILFYSSRGLSWLYVQSIRRRNEFEADAFAYHLLKEAGFGSTGSLRWLQRQMLEGNRDDEWSVKKFTERYEQYKKERFTFISNEYWAKIVAFIRFVSRLKYHRLFATHPTREERLDAVNKLNGTPSPVHLRPITGSAVIESPEIMAASAIADAAPPPSNTSSHEHVSPRDMRKELKTKAKITTTGNSLGTGKSGKLGQRKNIT